MAKSRGDDAKIDPKTYYVRVNERFGVGCTRGASSGSATSRSLPRRPAATGICHSLQTTFRRSIK
jgi:hypothetical protein